MRYRAEIDGLRAVALLPVMLFHAGLSAFSGGFVGVDIFFVISGYLITSILLTELNAGTFSLLRFYERRARRILPALFFVFAVCLPLAWILLLPDQLQSFSQSLAAVAVFGSNVFFWRTTGYFDMGSEMQPLLHTWSLAVEEQYYLFFPVFLMLAWRLGKRWVGAILGVILFVSLAVAQWGSLANPGPAFYLLPTRGWELLIGAMVALYLARDGRPHVSDRVRELASAAGMGLIGFSIFVLDKSTPYPGVYALLPTIGTAMVIVYATQGTTVARLLGSAPLVGIGLGSYSAYLWHQPLFAFARHGMNGEPSPSLLVGLSVLALVFAYFTWKYVEQPFRSKRALFSGKQVFAFGAAGSAFFLSVGLLGHMTEGVKSRLPPNLAWESLGEKLDMHGEICQLKPLAAYPGVLACEFGDRKAASSVLLYGDSHSQAISAELAQALVASKRKGIRLALEGCEIVPQIHNAATANPLSKDCAGRFDQLLAYVRAARTDLLIASRWTFKLYPVAGAIVDMPSVNSEGGRERDAPYREYAVLSGGKLLKDGDAKQAAVNHFISALLATGASVHLVYPVPEMSWDIARVNYEHFKNKGAVLKDISIPHDDFQRRNQFVHQIFDRYAGNPRFHAIKPEAIFCDTFIKQRCAAQYDTVPFYYDDDHLSDAGARLVVREIMNSVRKASSPLLVSDAHVIE